MGIHLKGPCSPAYKFITVLPFRLTAKFPLVWRWPEGPVGFTFPPLPRVGEGRVRGQGELAVTLAPP